MLLNNFPLCIYKYGRLLTHALKRSSRSRLAALPFWHLPTFAWFCFTTRLPCSYHCHILASLLARSFGPMSHPPSASLLLCLCSSEVLFEAHTSVEHGSRLVAVLFPSTKFPPTGGTQKSTHFPVPVPSSTRTICLVFARNQIFLCRQANKMALPARKKQEQECKHKTTAAAKTAPCLQSFAVKKLKNKVK